MHRTRSMCSWAVCLALAFSWSVEGAEIIRIPGDFPTIQAGIDAANDGDEIIVAPGTYNEVINFNGKAIALRSSDGPQVTTIDGRGLNNSVVKCISGEGRDTLLEGFTVTGGTGSNLEGIGIVGGGMRIDASSPRVVNCTFTRNSARSEGGGAGLWSSGGQPEILGCRFIENSASPRASGGGIECFASECRIIDCLFVGNFAADYGGGVHVQNTAATILQCLFVGNSAGGGGGVAGYSANVQLIASSLYGNSAVGGACCGGDGAGGGFLDRVASHVEATNTIFWANADFGGQDESAQIHIRSGTAVVNSCDVQGGWTGDGANNIDADPLFVDADNGDFRLGAGSPSIDAASNGAAPEGVDTDLDGNPRFVDDPETQDTGQGECQIVDMGAFEFQTLGGCCARIPAWVCDGDVDGDGQVNPVDSGIVQANFGNTNGQALCNYDVDCDGQINPVDAGIVQSLFGTCEEPRDGCQ